MFLDEENYIIPQTNTVVRGPKCITCVHEALLTAGFNSLQCRVLSMNRQKSDMGQNCMPGPGRNSTAW